MADPKPGSFSTFLEYSQRNAEPTSRAAASGPSSLLAIIRRGDENGVRTGELADRSKMDASAFHDALRKLSDSGFIELSGSPLPEVVKLTAKGREVADLLE